MHKPTLTFSVTPPPVNLCTKGLHSRAEESAFNSSDSSLREREDRLELEDKSGKVKINLYD